MHGALGALEAGASVSLNLMGGTPGTLAYVFLAIDPFGMPFLGGTLHAWPYGSIHLDVVDGLGNVERAGTWPAGFTGGTSVLQVGLDDPSVPYYGASLSNAVSAVIP